MNRERRDRLLEALFQVRPNEVRLTALLLSHCTCAVGAFIVGRSLRDALFLTHVGRERLPSMYVLSALAVALAGLLYAKFENRFRRDRLTAATAVALGFACLVLRAGARPGAAWVFSVLYVFIEVMGAIIVIQFWTMANDIYHARDAKRLFGTIATGGTLANILVGSLVGGLAKRVGAENLLFFVAALLFGCAVLVRLVGRRVPMRVAFRARGPRPASAAARVFGSPHLRTVAALAGVTFLATTLIDFQFKVAAAQSFPKDALAAFFGTFYAVTGVLALVVQMVGTGRLLARFGVVAGLAVLPLTLGLGAASLLVWPSLAAASATRGADYVFRYTLNDATTQLLYVPVVGSLRGAAKAFIDGVVKPGAIALGGVLLSLYRARFEVQTAPLAAATLGLCLLWGVVVFRLRGHYVTSLQETLRRRRLDLDAARGQLADGATARVLARALESDHPDEVLSALTLLRQLPKLDVDDKVEKLLESPRADVRTAALGHLAERGSLKYGNAVYGMFDDPDPGVRARAISAFCAIGREKAVRSVLQYLRDPSPAIRGAAIIGMIRYGGLDGVLAAAEALKELIGHEDPVMRQHAAQVLGAIGVRNFFQPVLELMADRELAVRRAAIHAAGLLHAPELAPSLVYRLAREETARDAAAALAAFGPGIEPMLGRVLDNRAEDPAIRRNVPQVLGRLATGPAIDVVTRHLQDSDEVLRRRLYKALTRALRTRQERAADTKAVLAALDNELRRAYAALAARLALDLKPMGPPGSLRSGRQAAEGLLHAALTEKVGQAEERIFLLLGILYPEAGLEGAYAGFRDASGQEAARRRANAIELIDNVAGRALRRKLLPLLDDGPIAVRLRAVAGHFPAPPEAPEEHLRALVEDETAWVRACAAWLAAEMAEVRVADEVARLLDHPWEVVREAAMAALEALVPREALVERVRNKVNDESPRVRARAVALVG